MTHYEQNFAEEVASRVHRNQKYGGSFMYKKHLIDVHYALQQYFPRANGNLLDAAWLHDTIEDTSLNHDNLKELFNSEVANLVSAVSSVGVNRAAKTEYTINNLIQYPEAIPLKMADRLANMRFSSKENGRHIKMYSMELPLYADLFKETNEKMYNEMLDLCVTI